MPVRNLAECDAALREIAEIDITVEKAITTKKGAVQRAEAAYVESTQEPAARRSKLQAEVQAWYEAHASELTAEHAGNKSMKRPFGTLGKKLGGKSLSLIEGWTWDKVTSTIKQAFKADAAMLKLLIVTKEDLDKTAAKKVLDDKQLKRVGLQIKQDEEFFLETHLDALRAA